jgi:hypothetical protein
MGMGGPNVTCDGGERLSSTSSWLPIGQTAEISRRCPVKTAMRVLTSHQSAHGHLGRQSRSPLATLVHQGSDPTLLVRGGLVAENVEQ